METHRLPLYELFFLSFAFGCLSLGDTYYYYEELVITTLFYGCELDSGLPGFLTWNVMVFGGFFLPRFFHSSSWFFASKPD